MFGKSPKAGMRNKEAASSVAVSTLDIITIAATGATLVIAALI